MGEAKAKYSCLPAPSSKPHRNVSMPNQTGIGPKPRGTGPAVFEARIGDRAKSESGIRSGPFLCWALCVLAALMLVATTAGCSGCHRLPWAKNVTNEEEENLKKKTERPKDPFELERLVVLPNEQDMPKNLIKPGHWVSAVQQMKASNDDFVGQLYATCVGGNDQLLELERSRYRVQFVRPASLPKGQTKQFELIYFVPRLPAGESRQVRLQSVLTTRAGVRQHFPNSEPAMRLKPHQYHFVVLSALPDQYGYLKKMPAIAPPRGDEWSTYGLDVDYMVLLPKVGRRALLPANALAWTSIALVLWDDYDPNLLAPDQQVAMLDWLHWGGQLVVSGPFSLERLQGSFLADYLPARAGAAVKISRNIPEQLDDGWYVHGNLEQMASEQSEESRVERGGLPEVISLEVHPEAAFVPHSGQLLAERRTGRGRIVVSAFSLADRQFVNRKRFDEFFHACILRRPPREFLLTQQQVRDMQWTDGPTSKLDPRRTSSLRFFSRDAGGSTAASLARRQADGPQRSGEGLFDTSGYQADSQSGVAGWTDFSSVATAARDALEEASGISVPTATFVLQSLAVYLLFLVPLNWGVFRLIGRVEWAWAAAPVIAMIGTIAVVRLAQLDIGFVRSRTEIAVVEVQSPYRRAHVTRYAGLYSSLSSRYDLEFDEPSALAQPFSLDPSAERLRLQTRQTVDLRQAKTVQLTGFPVLSNSTGMIHSEQMFTIAGPIYLAGLEGQALRVVNESQFDLRDVGLVRSRGEDGVEAAVLDRLPSGGSAVLRFEPAGLTTLRQTWDQSESTVQVRGHGQVSLRSLLELALEQLNDCDLRLVGWTDQQVPGVSIRPRASQETFRTFLLAHLRYRALGEPQGDVAKYPEIKAQLDQMHSSGVTPADGRE